MPIFSKSPEKEEPSAEKKASPVKVEINEKEAEGIYSNLVFLSYSPSEFILDFARILPGTPKARVYARIVMTPQNTKSLLGALQTRIEKYEGQFGKIKVPVGPSSATTREIGFK